MCVYIYIYIYIYINGSSISTYSLNPTTSCLHCCSPITSFLENNILICIPASPLVPVVHSLPGERSFKSVNQIMLLPYLKPSNGTFYL